LAIKTQASPAKFILKSSSLGGSLFNVLALNFDLGEGF